MAPTATWTVTASASGPGTITPANSTVNNGATAILTVTPDAGNLVQQVSGCGGTLNGTTYTTGIITSDCTVTATFSVPYTIGGTVSGLAWGYGLTLHNGTDTITVGSAGGSFVFPVAIADGASYAVTVDDPPEMKCTVTNGAGTVNGANVTNVDVTCKNRVAALYSATGANWNDYVKNDGADLSSATGAACVGNETGGYSACIHGGERRVFAVAGAQSCLGLTATDALDAFDWRCDESQGYVRFLSGRLKYDRRLADLIDFSKPAWKENAVTVKNGDATVSTSASTSWWSNPLVVDNDGITTAVAGTLYLVTADGQGSYHLDADKSGLVVRPGVQLSGAGMNAALVSATGHKFLWLEGSFNAAQEAYGLSLNGLSFSVVRAVNITNASNRGIYLESSQSNALSQLMLANNNGAIYVHGGTRNLLAGVTAVNGLSGVVIDMSTNNVLREITAADNTAYGILLNVSSGNVVASAALANNGGTALYLNYMKNLFMDLAVANNEQGISLENSIGNLFYGLLKLGSNTADCVINGGTNPGLAVVNGTCANQGASNATITTGNTLASSFAGKVAVDELLNGSDSDGAAASFPATPALFDWWRFDNALRAWGSDGAAFPSSSNRGQWTTGAGRIWDWSAKTGDSVIKEVLSSPGGNDTITHTWSDSTTTTFLRHAQEVDGDADGLCESNETCRYTANIGAYQGHGNLYVGTFTNGTITGVKLLQYQYNGR